VRPDPELIKALASPTGQRITPEDWVLLANARPSQPFAYKAPEPRHTPISEEVLVRLVIEGASPNRKLPSDPELQPFAQRLWKEMDELPPGTIVDIPSSF
jgi:hypothetical protein